MGGPMTDLLDRPSPEPPPDSEAGAAPGASPGAAPGSDLVDLDPEPPVRRAGRDPERLLESVLTFLMVAAAVVFTLSRLHPGLILRNTTPAGGDFGAHVWGPAFLRDHLLPHFRLSGWAHDWYAGLPMYRFYMVVPALLVVLVDLVAPYGVALKLISVLGIATLPVVTWA